MEPLELPVDPLYAKRASRMLILMLVNWLIMGAVLMTIGRQNLMIGGISFLFGLLAFGAAVGQRRGIKLASQLPLLTADEDGLRFRRFSGSQMEFAEWPGVTVEGSVKVPNLRCELGGGRWARFSLEPLSRSDADRILRVCDEMGSKSELEEDPSPGATPVEKEPSAEQESTE